MTEKKKRNFSFTLSASSAVIPYPLGRSAIAMELVNGIESRDCERGENFPILRWMEFTMPGLRIYVHAHEYQPQSANVSHFRFRFIHGAYAHNHHAVKYTSKVRKSIIVTSVTQI